MERIYHGKHFTIRITGVRMQEVDPEVLERMETARKALDKALFAFMDRVAMEKYRRIVQGMESTPEGVEV